MNGGGSVKKRVRELIKDAVIVVLAVSLVVLAVLSLPTQSIRKSPFLSSLLQPLASLLGLEEAELAYLEVNEPVMDAAQPLAISVNTAAGRYTAIWDFDALDETFETLGGALGQALDTAHTPEVSTRSALRTALQGESAYFSYGLRLPAAVLASWLDAAPEEALPQVDACALVIEDEAVALYLVGSTVQKAATGLSAETLSPLLSQFRPDGSAFAFETTATVDGFSLLPTGTPALPDAQLSSPCDSRFTEALATALGFNPYGDTTYTDAAGVTSFTEAGCALEAAPDGQIRLTVTANDRFRAADETEEALVEEARRLVTLTAGESAGAARLYLTEITQNDAGETICAFDYYLSGVKVTLSTGHAAEVTFLGQSVRSMIVQALTFTTTGATLPLMPVTQAAAILAPGESLALSYQLQGSTLQAGWVR